MQALTCNFIKKYWHRCFPVNSCEILRAPFSIEHLCWMLLILLLLLNRDLNRDCLVYMFSLRFSGSKFLINLRRQFRVKFFVHKFLGDLQSFHLMFKTTISKMHNLDCYFIKTYSLTGC